MRSYQAGLTEMIRQGIESGEFRAVDPQSVVVAIMGMYEGLGLLWLIDPETVPLRHSMEASLKLLLEGIRKQPGGS